MVNYKEIVKITDEYPTYIVKDFLTFLGYIENNTIKLTKTNQYFTRKDLVSVYSLMSEPKLNVSVKSNQPAYPLLHLFFHLALQLELLQKRSVGGGMIAAVHREHLVEFKRMTPSERYVSLLECFWTEADWKELQGGYYGKAPSNVDVLFEFLEPFPANKELKVSRYGNLKYVLFDYEHFLFYFSYFGLWNIVLDEEKTKEKSVNYHEAKTIVLTPLFKCLERVLVETWEDRTHSLMDALDILDFLQIFSPSPILEEIQVHQQEENEQKESLFTLLKPLFAEGELTTTLNNREKTIVNGKYLFKVALNHSCWRTVQLSESHTLLDLHELIQEAFAFDDDHLYAFYMDRKKFSKHCYNSPLDSNGPFVNDAKIGNLHLYEGQRFLYLFDFGDEWEFNIDIMKITEGIENVSALICDRKGNAPLQYGW